MSFSVWENQKLGDICVKIGSGATPRGGKEVYFDEGPVALIRSQNVLDFSFSYDGLAYIDKEQAAQLSNVEIERDDVLLNITGDSVARVCQVPNELLPARVNQHVSIIRPNKQRLDNQFLKYYLLNPQIKKQLLAFASVGATRKALTKGMIEDFDITLPDLHTQKRIAGILSALDEKIELNRQTNATLEAIAQAIFKEWFVHYNYPGATGHLVDSELGMFPARWRVGNLGDLCYVQNGFAFKSQDFSDEGTVGIIKIKNIDGTTVDIQNMQFVEPSVVADLDPKFKLRAGDLLIAMTGAKVGKVGIVPIGDKEIWLNQRVGSFIETKPYSKLFLYILLSSETYQETIRGFAIGSAQPNISASAIESIRALVPNTSALEKFGVTTSPLFEQMAQNLYESAILTQIRDTLLPKLMRGEIEI